MTVLARPEVVIGGDWAPLARTLDQASSRLQSAGASMQRVGTQLTAAVTLPILGIGAAAVKATANWETAMVGVQKTVDASANEIARLGDGFMRLSEEVPVAASELAGIAAEAGQLGIRLDNLEGFTEVIAGLRVTTNLGEQAGSTLARLANIMGTSQTDFDRMGSTIVELGNNLATTEAEIADMALRIAGAGRQIGLTEAQVLSFAGALSSVGIRAEAGGTAISRVMVDVATAVEKSGAELDRFAAVAGVSAREFKERFESDAAAALSMFIVGLGDLESQGKSTFGVLEELGLADIRVRDTLLRASGAADLFTDALGLGSRAWEENTALTKEAELFYGRLSAQFTTTLNKIKNVAAEFGDSLRPAINLVLQGVDGLLDRLRRLVEWFADLSPEMRTTVALIVGIGIAIPPAVAALGTLVVALGAVAASVTAIAGAFAGLNTVLATGAVATFLSGGWAVAGMFALAGAIGAIAGAIIRMNNAAAEMPVEKIQDLGSAGLIDTSHRAPNQPPGGAAHPDALPAPDPAPVIQYSASIRELGERIQHVTVGAINPMTGALITLDEMMARSAADRWADAIERGAAVTESVKTATEVYAERMEELNYLLSQGAITQQTFVTAAKMAHAASIDNAKSTKAHADATRDLNSELSKATGFLSSLGSIASVFGGIPFLGQATSILSAIPGLGGIFGGGGAKKLKNFKGGFALGGTIPAGDWGIVGEAGPEIVSGPADVTPMGEASGAVTINMPPPSSRMEHIFQTWLEDGLKRAEHNGLKVSFG